MSCVPLVLLAVLAAPDAASSPAPDAVATQIERVASAYDQGNCTEVLAAIRSLPNPEQDLALDGLSQYRWGFCLGLTGQGDPNSHYTAAADILGLELKSRSPRLDAFFYRVNALQNLKRADEATATAKDAIARWKAGTLTAPAGAPASWFQLGKLFVDGGDPKGAAAHYRRALDAAAESKRPLRSVYTERIADFALAHKDTDLARKAVSALSAADPDSLSTIERSGRLLLALGDVAGARDQFPQGGPHRGRGCSGGPVHGQRPGPRTRTQRVGREAAGHPAQRQGDLRSFERRTPGGAEGLRHGLSAGAGSGRRGPPPQGPGHSAGPASRCRATLARGPGSVRGLAPGSPAPAGDVAGVVRARRVRPADPQRLGWRIHAASGPGPVEPAH